MADKIDKSTYEKLVTSFRDLRKLFQNGPVVKHRVARQITEPGDRNMSPVGTAAAFLKNNSNVFASQMASYGDYNRLARYSDYQEMESMAEINSALDIYADEATSEGENEKILAVESDNPHIKQILNNLFYDTLNIEFEAWEWIRNMVKYGDQFLFIDYNPDYGVIGLYPLPVNEVVREEGYDDNNPLAIRFRWQTQGNRVLEYWQVLHLRIKGNSDFLPYGASLLEGARRVWRQLILMEDAVMVYRIVRSPERRVFYIDVGSIDPNDVGKFMEKTKTQLKRNQVVDNSSGRVDLRYNPMSTDEDYFIPVRGPDTGTRVDNLPGGQFTGDIEDLQYIQSKLFAALKVPKSYLGYEDAIGKSTLSQEDIRFSKTVQRIQRVFLAELNRVAIVHLYAAGYRDEDLLNFELRMANPSNISELQRLELMRTRIEVATMGVDNIVDRYYIYKELLKLDDDQIAAIEEGRKRDALLDIEIQNIGSEAPPAEEPAGGEEPAAGGESPETVLPEPSQEGRKITAKKKGQDPNQQKGAPNELIKVKRPRKKHSHFPDLYNQVTNMKKNAMSDPGDVGHHRRKATAPFGEGAEDKAFDLQRRNIDIMQKKLERLDKDLYKSTGYKSKVKKVIKD